MSSTEPIFLTKREVCAMLRIGNGALATLIRSGDLPYIRLGTAYRFEKSEIERWIAQRRQGGAV